MVCFLYQQLCLFLAFLFSIHYIFKFYLSQYCRTFPNIQNSIPSAQRYNAKWSGDKSLFFSFYSLSGFTQFFIIKDCWPEVCISIKSNILFVGLYLISQCFSFRLFSVNMNFGNKVNLVIPCYNSWEYYLWFIKLRFIAKFWLKCLSSLQLQLPVSNCQHFDPVEFIRSNFSIVNGSPKLVFKFSYKIWN